MKRERIEALRRLEAANGVDCMALVPGANLRYFTDLPMQLSERPTVAFLPVARAPAVLLPELESAAARSRVGPEAQFFTYRDEEGHEQVFGHTVEALGLAGKTIAVEFLAMRVLEMRRIEQAAPGCRLVAAEPWLPQLRVRKDDQERAHVRRAVEIAERALQGLLGAGAIQPGRSERELAADLQVALLREGSQALPFTPIVLAGPNSAQPHAGPSDRKLESGDLVILDWGAVYEGYQSDLTRTFVLGKPTDTIERIYDAVLAANQAGRLTARSAMPAQDVDRAARRTIGSAGYGERFVHRTGHGIGLETHEPPYIVEGNLDLLQPGMVFTVEPGVYLPGVGGVRIEDDVLVTDDGAETLSSLSRELLRL